MQLDTYISDLLYRYECVTLPTFGAFLTHSISAKIHETTSTFYPPKKVVSFNEQLQNNDGLLANYIAEVEKIPYQLAVQKIINQVNLLKTSLLNGETVVFKNIGAVLLNAEGSIVFKPSYTINYLKDAFGLSHFTSNNVTREIIEKDEIVTVEEVDKAPIILTPEDKSSNWKKYAAAAVLLIGFGSLASGKLYFDTINSQNEIAQQKANTEIDSQIQKATFFINEPLPSATLSINQESGNFHIVAGAFRVEANSDKKVEQLKSLGFKARKIGTNRFGLHQVAYSSHVNREDAQAAMNNIRESYNKDAWLLVKDLSN